MGEEIITVEALDEKYRRAAAVICKQGMIQFPVNETAVEIVRRTAGPAADELDLIYAFRESPSQTRPQLAESSGFTEEKADRLAGSLAKKGLVFNQPSSSGLMVYRILPFMLVGVMEYKFMTDLTGTDEERELAELFEKMIGDLRDQVQDDYDVMAPLFEKAPPVDRTVPPLTAEGGKGIHVLALNQPLDTPEEFILPSQTVEEIIRKFDDIAVGHCFCRQRRRVLGEACSSQAPTLNCFTFGKSARHTAAQGFAKKISQEQALKIMKEAEASGLVHKAFHPGFKESKPETSICNCCKDCCDTLQLWRNGTMPLINSTYHLSIIDREACSGCGTCVEWCPTDAIELDDQELATRDEKACFGCGICARFCPDEAISLQQGLRKVFILPPRLRVKA